MPGVLPTLCSLTCGSVAATALGVNETPAPLQHASSPRRIPHLEHVKAGGGCMSTARRTAAPLTALFPAAPAPPRVQGQQSTPLLVPVAVPTFVGVRLNKR